MDKRDENTNEIFRFSFLKSKQIELKRKIDFIKSKKKKMLEGSACFCFGTYFGYN